MTNPIGTGTRNMTINVPVDEQLVITHAAYKAGCRSVGDYLRKLLLSGAEIQSPELAQELREIRRRYYGAAFLLLFSGVMALSWAQSFAPRSVRSAARPCRVAKARRDNLEFDDFTGGIVEPTFDEVVG